MTKEELEQELEILEERRFMVDMIDHWDEEDKQLYNDLSDKINELNEKLEKLNEK